MTGIAAKKPGSVQLKALIGLDYYPDALCTIFASDQQNVKSVGIEACDGVPLMQSRFSPDVQGAAEQCD